MAVRPIDGNELLDIERLLDTDVVRQSKTASWLLDQVLHDIQAMPTLTPPNEWVSVEDRLPEDDTSEYKAQIAVLVLTDRESIKIKKRTYHPGRVYYGKFYPERWDWGTFNDDRITHWMPLPAPPDRRPPEGEEDA